MPKTLSLELPDGAFSALRSSPEEFGRELRLAAAIKWYEMERISQGKAAEGAMSRHWVVDASDHSPREDGASRPARLHGRTSDPESGGQGDPARTVGRSGPAWLDAKGEQFVEPTGTVPETVAAWDLGRGESRVLSVGACRPISSDNSAADPFVQSCACRSSH